MNIPKLHPPAPQSGLDTHPFARYSITTRFPNIVRQVLAERPWPSATVAHLESLIGEIPDGKIHPIQDDGGPDVAAWHQYIQPYLGMNWLETP